mgnify:CR=1 FL=1
MGVPVPDDFTEFWAIYPRKVGKLAAEKAYAKARQVASQEELLAGVERYKRNKPGYADWCHPRTWLVQGRWLDEYAPAEQPKVASRRPAWAQQE